MRTALLCGHYDMSCRGYLIWEIKYYKFKKVLIFHGAKLSKQNFIPG